jgi:hypothetical protein
VQVIYLITGRNEITGFFPKNAVLQRNSDLIITKYWRPITMTMRRGSNRTRGLRGTRREREKENQKIIKKIIRLLRRDVFIILPLLRFLSSDENDWFKILVRGPTLSLKTFHRLPPMGGDFLLKNHQMYSLRNM